MHASHYDPCGDARLKRLNVLKLRVELIAWRIEDIGMSAEIREALPESAIDVIEFLLHEQNTPDDALMCLYESTVREVEDKLTERTFWRSGSETLH